MWSGRGHCRAGRVEQAVLAAVAGSGQRGSRRCLSRWTRPSCSVGLVVAACASWPSTVKAGGWALAGALGASGLALAC